jgi:hypothetical protein
MQIQGFLSAFARKSALQRFNHREKSQNVSGLLQLFTALHQNIPEDYRRVNSLFAQPVEMAKSLPFKARRVKVEGVEA